MGPPELPAVGLDQPVTGCQLGEDLPVDRQRVWPADVDQQGLSTLLVGRPRGQIQRDRNRSRLGIPGRQGVQAGEGDMAFRPSAVCSNTTAMSASLSDASPASVWPWTVAVATTGTRSRTAHSPATARR